ncbi:ATP-binding protein [Sphingomonas sp. TREG-RG-20F-R18-01]|uniref:sensor histidine kinase n=1 Tax=Sphingomonas sp. TREG-RG-20F-R18-01 TaxID=2914982 RepID=UPI001F5720BA|nr:ATP-binding protein [Sphingomonas sp. TREG-RG-20F-R18-01]
MARLFPVQRYAILLVALLLAVAVGWGTGTAVEQSARARLATSVAADARLRAALLASEIARFRLLPLALADDRDVVAALAGGAGATDALNRKLERLAALTGAAAMYVIAPDGHAIAASNFRSSHSFVASDYRFRPYFQDARRRGEGRQFALGTVSNRPGLYLARRTAAGGVVVVKLDFAAIERQWAAAGGVTYVTDPAGLILIASRPAWRFATTRPLSPALRQRALRESGAAALRGVPFQRDGAGLIRIAGIPGALLVEQTAPDFAGWRVTLAQSTRLAVDDVARAVAAAAGVLALALIGLAYGAWSRARRRAERTSLLESAVADRTAALSREIEERAALETRAGALREALRQANRLATLGQVTASVAHETAQPVAAIRTYAATGETLLDRGATEQVRGNLRAIARLTERIGAVTAQLRGFARKASGEIGPVALTDVIEGAQLILRDRLSRVAVDWPTFPAGLDVVAGRIRLEQVLVNVLQNATEAVATVDAPRIVVTLDRRADTVVLQIRDNGPGIAPDIADRLFTPFATSRAAGLGLGLVIAKDIMEDLGGHLRLVPGGGGACFEILLRRAP